MVALNAIMPYFLQHAGGGRIFNEPPIRMLCITSILICLRVLAPSCETVPSRFTATTARLRTMLRRDTRVATQKSGLAYVHSVNVSRSPNVTAH
jgi:hypothetical protein